MQKDSRPPAVLVKPAEVAAKLNVGENTLAKWRLSGRGPAFVKVGARVMYDAATVEAWIASRVRNSTSDCGKAA
jgi:hypothetical protein